LSALVELPEKLGRLGDADPAQDNTLEPLIFTERHAHGGDPVLTVDRYEFLPTASAGKNADDRKADRVGVERFSNFPGARGVKGTLRRRLGRYVCYRNPLGSPLEV